MITKKFSREYLKEELGLPSDCEDGVVVKDEIVDQSRWATHYELIWKEPGTDNYWLCSYSRGSTECQDERPWQYEKEVECTLVHQVEKVVKVWEAVE